MGIGTAALIAASVGAAIAADPEAGPMRITHVPDGVTWQDQPNEASYHVSGSINYWPAPSCGPDRLQIDGEKVSFDETLAADTTSFAFPTPSDARLTFTKDMQFSIEALNANGDVIAQDGFGFTADKFCTPEEIAAELAAAGSGGPLSGGSDRPIVGATLLGIAGIAAFGTAGLMRRKAP